MLTLTECREIANKGNIKYTDEQLIKMRDWLSNFANMALEHLEKYGADCFDELIAKTESKKDKRKVKNI